MKNGIDEEARNRFDFSGTSVFGICIRILGQRFKRNRHSPQKKKVWSSSSLATRVNWMFSSLRITNVEDGNSKREFNMYIYLSSMKIDRGICSKSWRRRRKNWVWFYLFMVLNRERKISMQILILVFTRERHCGRK